MELESPKKIKKNGKLAIVTGATGKLGYHVVKELIQKGYTVRIITRNHNSAKKIFGDLFDEMETPIVCDLAAESKVFEKSIDSGNLKNSLLEFAFEKGSENEIPSLVFCIQTKNAKTKEKCKYIEYYTTKFLVLLSKKYNIDKFIYISAAYVTKPYSLPCLLLNFFVDNVMYYKSLGENYVRQSGLNYIISRPVGLRGDHKESKRESVKLDQGDKLKGIQYVERASVAHNLMDLIEDKNVPNKFTYEILTEKSQQNQSYKYQPIKFKPDDSSSIIDSKKHLQAKKTIKTFLYIISGAIISSLSYYFYFKK